MALSVYNQPCNIYYDPLTDTATISGVTTISVSVGAVPTCNIAEINSKYRIYWGAASDDVLSCDWPLISGTRFKYLDVASDLNNEIITFVKSVSGAYFNTYYRDRDFYVKGYNYDNVRPTDKSRWVLYDDAPITLQLGCQCSLIGVLGNGGEISQSIDSLPPLPPEVPTYTLYNACYNSNISIKIDIDVPTTENATYYSIQRSATSGGTYTEIAKLYVSGGTYIYYDEDTSAETRYYYKVNAINSAYSIPPANVIGIDIKPLPITGLTAVIIDSDYPVLYFSGQTETYDCGSQLIWYMDDVQVATSVATTYVGLFPQPNQDIEITVVVSGATGQYSDVSNIVVLNYPIVISGTPVLSLDNYDEYANEIDLSWTRANANSNKIILQRNLNNGAFTTLFEYVDFPTRNLAHLYKCDESSGTVLTDSVGGSNGTLSFTTFTTGKLGNALRNNNSVTTYTSAHLGNIFHKAINEPFAISLWYKLGVYVDSTPATILSNTNFRFNYSTGNLEIVLVNPVAGNQIKVRKNISLNTDWYNFVITYDGSGLASGFKLFINSVEQILTVQDDNLTPYTPSTDNLVLFNSQIPNNQFNFDQIALYDDIILEQEVDTIYNSGAGKFYDTVTTYVDDAIDYTSKYCYKVYEAIDYWVTDILSPESNAVCQFTTVEVTKPINLYVDEIGFTTVKLHWENTNISGATGNKIEINTTGTTWTEIADISPTATEYVISGLFPTSTYNVSVKVYNNVFDATSDVTTFETLEIIPPTITGGSSTYTTVTINWENAGAYDFMRVVVYGETPLGEIETRWIIYPTAGVTTYTYERLYPDVTYNLYVEVSNLEYGSIYSGIWVKSNIWSESTKPFPPSFCLNASYEVTDTTCGNSNGSVEVASGYTELYDFKLEDYFGNTYPITNEIFSNLPSNYYKLTASPRKDAIYSFSLIYGDPCVFEFIHINDTNTDMSLIGTSIQGEQCGPFDIQYGRIFYNISGITTGTYTLSSIRLNGEVTVISGITDYTEVLLTNVESGCFYSILEHDGGCKLLLPVKCIPSAPIYSLGGIKEIYITTWSDDIDYNYWKTNDDDYFLEFEDKSFFISTKIKNFSSLSGGTLNWYKIPVAGQIVNLSQTLNKVRQGFIFQDELSIAIGKATADKWLQIQRLVSPQNRWLIVVKDNNGFWWTIGYRHGASISVYSFGSGSRGDDNGYSFTFTAQSENKLLTSIDENYVINNILN